MTWQAPPTPVLWCMAGTLIFLALATSLIWVLGRPQPQRNLGEVIQRVRSWWIIVGLLLGALLLSKTAAILFFALVSYLAFKEYLTLIPTRRADHRVLFWAYLTIPVQYWWVHIEWYGLFIIFVPVYMFLLLPTRMVLKGETEGFLKAAGTLHWGLMTTVFSLSHVAFLLVLPPEDRMDCSGIGLVLFLVGLTELNDVAQYVWGKSLGRRKVVPKVSPNKSWAGLLGGVVTTVSLALLLAPVLTPLVRRDAMFAGVIISLGGFLGDIVVSAVKRDIGIKDSGHILPGHGGILDRVDSLTYTAPLFLHFIRYFYF